MPYARTALTDAEMKQYRFEVFVPMNRAAQRRVDWRFHLVREIVDERVWSGHCDPSLGFLVIKATAAK